jgi:hypothetical protein
MLGGIISWTIDESVPDHWWESYKGYYLNDGKIVSIDVVNRIPVIRYFTRIF